MRELLAVLAIAASNATHESCAVVSNMANIVVWKRPGIAVRQARYRDLGDRLVHNRRVPGVVWMVEATLPIGPPGPKVRVACNIRMIH